MTVSGGRERNIASNASLWTWPEDTPLKVVDGFSEHHGKTGAYKGPGPMGSARVRLEGQAEGEWEVFLEHVLRELPKDERGA